MDSPLISDEDELQEDHSDEALDRIDDDELENHSGGGGRGAPNQVGSILSFNRIRTITFQALFLRW